MPDGRWREMRKGVLKNRKKQRKADKDNHICPLMSTTLCAWALASSNTRPALPVKSWTCPSLSCSSSPEAYSRTKRALCSSDSKPSSSVMNRIFTSGLYLLRVSNSQFSFNTGKGQTHVLQMQANALKRSRSTNMSIRYAPILGVSR